MFAKRASNSPRPCSTSTTPDEIARPSDTTERDWAAEAQQKSDVESLRRLGAEAQAAHAAPHARQAIRDRLAEIEADNQEGTNTQ